MRHSLTLTMAAVLSLAAVAPSRAESPAVMLENGLYTEQTVGDLTAAVRIYKQVLAHAQAQDDQKAQAQFRIGMCYMKQRQGPQAREAFRALIKDFPQQKELAAAATLRIQRLTDPNPASLMPPGTVAYFEIGSPGHQVEKIVNMLKGTPLANPLAVIGGPRRPTTQPRRPEGQTKTPADIIAALLNPSMLAEFKKVRGMAVGVSGIDLRGREPPPFVAVLYPGESDALRGILTAALLMVGQEDQPIEGMQTLTLHQAGRIACGYDENVFILANSRTQLAWSVKQYKGLAREPSLASAGGSFSKLTSAEARRTDAVTAWGDLAAIFSAVKEQAAAQSRGRGMDRWLLAIDAIADVRSIEGAVARLVIDEKSPYAEATVAFKPEHKCLPYDLIRTPHLSQAGFEGVPAEAVAVISVALGQARGGEEAIPAREAVRHLTGLDIGREIFANIEQINLFAMPLDGEPARSPLARISPVVPCIGLAITSRDPQKTQMLLDRLLSLPAAILDVQAGERAEPRPKIPGRYFLGRQRNQDIYCHLGQAGRSTVIALDPRVVKAALACVKAGKGAAAAGPLHAALSRLPAGTSKLVVANAGGALRLGLMHLTSIMPARARTQPSVQKKLAALSGLAKALAETHIQINTLEHPQSITVRMSVNNLPPLGELFPLVMSAR